MQRLFLFLLVALPWWGYLALSGGVAWLGYEAYQKERVELAERQAQAMAPPPEVVDLSQFDLSRDVAPADELHVRGWINTDYSYELIKRTNGVRTGTRFMYVLFGSEDDAASKQARAAVVMTEADKDRFVDDIFDHVVGFNAQGPVIALNGFRGSGDGYASMVSEALAEKGLTRAPDFVFVEPFLDGRQAALTATGEPLRVLGVFLLFAAAFAMAGLAKLVFSRRRAGAAVMPRRGKAAPARDPFANGPIAGEGRPAPSDQTARTRGSEGPTGWGTDRAHVAIRCFGVRGSVGAGIGCNSATENRARGAFPQAVGGDCGSDRDWSGGAGCVFPAAAHLSARLHWKYLVRAFQAQCGAG